MKIYVKKRTIKLSYRSRLAIDPLTSSLMDLKISCQILVSKKYNCQSEILQKISSYVKKTKLKRSIKYDISFFIIHTHEVIYELENDPSSY